MTALCWVFPGAAATINVDTTTLSTQNVLTVTGANSTIQRVDAALSFGELAAQLAGFDAEPLRVDDHQLAGRDGDLSASRSRILDTDFAAETANLTKRRSCSRLAPPSWLRRMPHRSLVLSLLK